MATDFVMPQMGESIAEGTIVRWIKKLGEKVDRDEPLFEISTDKVDAEIPSPAAGVVTEIRAKEGDTVPINTVVAVIGTASAARGAGAASESQVATPPRPAAAPQPAARESGAPPPSPGGIPAAARPASTTAASGAGLAGQSIPMSVMRRKIAEHMVLSRRTSAHVHSVFEVNFHNVEKVRQGRKAEYERAGAKL